jgi:phospholipase C
MRVKKGQAIGFLIALICSPLPFSVRAATAKSNSPIKQVIVIVEENHTFDNYFGTYPGVNGLNGSTIALPVTISGPSVSKPFHLSNVTVPHDLCHGWDCAHQAYDNGKMDGFVIAAKSNLTMGYFNHHQIPYYWDYASQFVLLDNFYTSIMAQSLPNHLYLVAGQSGSLTTGSRFGTFNFTSSNIHNGQFEFKSIVDELDANRISWKYYAGGHQSLNNWNPLPAFASFKSNQSRMNNLAEPTKFLGDVASNKLANVVWIMPATDDSSEHAPYDITIGERATVNIINAIMRSEYWSSTAIFVTWDDYGGWYDHVAPPQVDAFGFGFRAPCLIISPYARQGFIDHTQGDFTSFLKFIETVYSLPPLTSRDGLANSLMEAFDFSQHPRSPLLLPGQFIPDRYPLTFLNGTLLQSTTSTTTPAPISALDVIAALLVASAAVVGLALVLVSRRVSRTRHE